MKFRMIFACSVASPFVTLLTIVQLAIFPSFTYSSPTIFSDEIRFLADTVAAVAAEKIVELHGKGRVDGIITWPGGVGTTIATIVIRALPIGVPKIMLSTLASSDVSTWVGNKDIY